MPLELQPLRAVVHSFNEFGAPKMVEVLSEGGINADWFAFNTAEFTNAVGEVISKSSEHKLSADEDMYTL